MTVLISKPNDWLLATILAKPSTPFSKPYVLTNLRFADILPINFSITTPNCFPVAIISDIALSVSSTLPIALSKLKPIPSKASAKAGASNPPKVLVNNAALSSTSGEILSFLPTSMVIDLKVSYNWCTWIPNFALEAPASFNSLIVSNNCSFDIPILWDMSTRRVSSNANISRMTSMLSINLKLAEPISVITSCIFSMSPHSTPSLGVRFLPALSAYLPNFVVAEPLLPPVDSLYPLLPWQNQLLPPTTKVLPRGFELVAHMLSASDWSL